MPLVMSLPRILTMGGSAFLMDQEALKCKKHDASAIFETCTDTEWQHLSRRKTTTDSPVPRGCDLVCFSSDGNGVN